MQASDGTRYNSSLSPAFGFLALFVVWSVLFCQGSILVVLLCSFSHRIVPNIIIGMKLVSRSSPDGLTFGDCPTSATNAVSGWHKPHKQYAPCNSRYQAVLGCQRCAQHHRRRRKHGTHMLLLQLGLIVVEREQTRKKDAVAR